MNEPLPPTLTPHDSLNYQPISAWAIAGFATGSLFALLVGISTAVALFQGAPIFFPTWILGFALFGIVLSLIGQQHVHNSEGTRAGAKLARIGLWLSLFSGAGYFSYVYITGLALQSQANAFLMNMGDDSGFFPRLREGGLVQINSAFLLSLPATSRGGRPEDDLGMQRYHDAPGKDGAPGNLSQFKDSIYARIFFGDLAKDAEIIPLSVQSWRYEKRSYKIQRQYRVKTREADVVFLMTVQSTEAETAGESRKWFVNLTESTPQTVGLTPFGESIRLLRGQARDKFELWVKSLNEGQPFTAFKDRDQTTWNRLLVEDKERNRKAVTLAFTEGRPGRLGRFESHTRPGDVGNWEQVDGRIRIYQKFSFMLLTDRGLGVPTVFGYIALDTRQAVDPAHFDHASPLPEWDVTRVVVTNIISTKGLSSK